MKRARNLWLKRLAWTCAIVICLPLVLFRGDWRALTGYDVFVSATDGKIIFDSDDPDALDWGELRVVWTSKASTRAEAGGNPNLPNDGGITFFSWGPTIFLFRSGRIVFAAGCQYSRKPDSVKTYVQPK